MLMPEVNGGQEPPLSWPTKGQDRKPSDLEMPNVLRARRPENPSGKLQGRLASGGRQRRRNKVNGITLDDGRSESDGDNELDNKEDESQFCLDGGVRS